MTERYFHSCQINGPKYRYVMNILVVSYTEPTLSVWECERDCLFFHLSAGQVSLRSFYKFPSISQVGHFTGAGTSLDNRSLLWTCWLGCPGKPGKATRLFIGTVLLCMASVVATIVYIFARLKFQFDIVVLVFLVAPMMLADGLDMVLWAGLVPLMGNGDWWILMGINILWLILMELIKEY